MFWLNQTAFKVLTLLYSGPCKPCQTLDSFKRRQGLKAQLNLPLDLVFGSLHPLTLWAQEKTAPYSLPGAEEELHTCQLNEYKTALKLIRTKISIPRSTMTTPRGPHPASGEVA